MRNHTALFAVVLLAGCDNKLEPKDGSAVRSTERSTSGVSASPSSDGGGSGPQTVARTDLPGLYARRCLGERLKGVWSEITLEKGGRYAVLDHGVNAEFRYRGRFTYEGDRLTFHPDEAKSKSTEDVYIVRQHRGRRMLLWGKQLEAFELLPSWRLGYVQLSSPDERSSICSKMPKLDNPSDPSNPKVRLPQRLELVVPAWDPGGPYAAHVTLRLAPYEGEMAVCHEAGCASPHRAPMTIADWIEVNRAWWAIERAAGTCPDRAAGQPEPERAYRITHGDRTMTGAVPSESTDAGRPEPCEARNSLVQMIQLRIGSMHPP